MPVEQGGEHHVSALLRAEQSAAPDCLQRPLPLPAAGELGRSVLIFKYPLVSIRSVGGVM